MLAFKLKLESKVKLPEFTIKSFITINLEFKVGKHYHVKYMKDNILQYMRYHEVSNSAVVLITVSKSQGFNFLELNRSFRGLPVEGNIHRFQSYSFYSNFQISLSICSRDTNVQLTLNFRGKYVNIEQVVNSKLTKVFEWHEI